MLKMLTHFLPSKLCATYSYAQVKFEKNEWCHKKKKSYKIIYAPILFVWWNCTMFACQLDNNLFALPLFEGICHGNSTNNSISLQRATLGAGLQNRTTTTTSGAWSWCKMSL
jgi:hypothetical protein